ncbi:MAG: glycosyltransferase family 39 protein [Polyangiaceae bacterium]|nr:glycosyltransferase family 39 protein [Polyangiaceae bacterium]
MNADGEEYTSRQKPASAARGGDLWFSAALFVLALLPRIYVAIAWPREPVWDGHYYDFGARRIAEGLGYSDDVMIAGQKVWHPWCHYPVGYSGFLGFFYAIFGAGQHVGPLVNAIVGALTVVLVHRIARFATTPLRARIAGALTAFHPGLILYTALLMTEPLAAFSLLLAALLYLWQQEKPIRAGAISGIVLGLGTLVRPPSLLLAPALFFLAPKAGATWQKRLVGPLAACLFTVLTVLPWTVRNCRVMDGCAFVSTNAGWNLMIGAFPRATGRFETIRATDGCPVVTGQVAQDRCWMDTGIDHIQKEPGRWLSLIPKKLGYTFDHESFPIGYLGEANPTAWPESRKERGRAILGGVHTFLLVIAAFGALPWMGRRVNRQNAPIWAMAMVNVGLVAWALLSDTHPFWPLAMTTAVWPFAAWLILRGKKSDEVETVESTRQRALVYIGWIIASVAVVSIVFFGEDRYHMVASPAVCLLAACAFGRRAAP